MSSAFYLVIVDHHRRVFNVVGPMNDDSFYTDAVAECLKGGRQVNCFNVPATKGMEQIALEYAAQTGNSFVSEPVLIAD